MATVDELAHRIYPRMVSSGSQAASSPAPSRSMNDIARSLYPKMASAAGPSRTTEPGARSGFVRRVLTCHMTGPARGQLYYVDVPVRRTL
jgi:hypothetical protein